ncbi:MAG: hypothetical protein LIO79_06040 [Rikenellaceae bacterium]|nr:hypothetical protein [Rikenellaceae bacterium]
MARHYYVILFLTIFLYGCSKENDTVISGFETTARIKLLSSGFRTKTVDQDNPASEQLIDKVALFLTEPSSEAITEKFLDAGFSDYDDYCIVTLPLEPAELGIRDIYAVTNYDTIDFSSITTISELDGFKTPVVNKTYNLDPANGFCMYGSTSGFDFTSGTDDYAIVTVERTCAKIGVRLTFPDNTSLSTNNSFLIANAASYTYIVEPSEITELPSGGYFNFAAPLPLEVNESEEFTGTAYIYQSAIAPTIYFYTHINGSIEEQEFSAPLPIPDRNYYYDLDVRIYEDTESTRSMGGGYTIIVNVTAYNAYGDRIEL